MKVKGLDRVNRDLRSLRRGFSRAADRALHREALRWEGEMKKGITRGAPGGAKFYPLSYATLVIRAVLGHSGKRKPLMVTAQLRNSIKAMKIRSLKYFTGVHRMAKGKGGTKLVNIAGVMEFGKVIRVTEKMRGWWFAMVAKARALGYELSPLKPSKRWIWIPPRRFVAPVRKKMLPGMSNRILIDLKKTVLA